MIKTGFIELDALTNGGFMPGELVVLASRTAMGKTALALSMCCNVDAATLYISLQETAQQIKNKSCRINNGNKVNAVEIETNELDEIDGIISIDTAELIIVDDPHMLYNSPTAYENASAIPKRLKQIALKNKVVVVAVCQLTRNVDNRPGHIPRLGDLRDTGCWEEIADSVLLLHRRDYYDPIDKPGLATLAIAKNRRGMTGNVPLAFLSEKPAFGNLLSVY